MERKTRIRGTQRYVPLMNPPVPTSVQLPGAPPAGFGAGGVRWITIHSGKKHIAGAPRGKSKEGARRPPLGRFN